MKIARKAFEPYANIDPREVPIQDMVNDIDYQYVPALCLAFFLGAVVCCTLLILLALIFI